MSELELDAFHRYSGEQPININLGPSEIYNAFDEEKAKRLLAVFAAQESKDAAALKIARQELNQLL
jgi:hypothetical protein